MYEKSYMHRDTLTAIVVTSTDFLLTASADGVVKFWKKEVQGLEFVKELIAHVGAVTGLVASVDGAMAATIGQDAMLKTYDVVNFDMTHWISLDFSPSLVEFISRPGTGEILVAVADSASASVHVYDVQRGERVHSFAPHAAPVLCMRLNAAFDCVVSTDATGGIEFWSTLSFDQPTFLDFSFKAETDLYVLASKSTSAASLAISRDGKLVAMLCKDRHVRLFKFLSGKLYREYDESLATVNGLQKVESSPYHLDNIDFGRRFAVERAYDADSHTPAPSVLFDESGRFIIYATLVGIKIVHVKSNRVERLLGKVENSERFSLLALFQGAPATIKMGASGTGAAVTVKNRSGLEDPTLFCTAYNKARFYLFTQREPAEATTDDVGAGASRDIFNEKPAKEELSVAMGAAAQTTLPRKVVLHTTRGDIHIALFAADCPKTVENFTTHCRDGYFDNIIFHRVIQGFMIQTGDPLGNGTGGESIWGSTFEDEFVRHLKHDRPFTVSMANSGPATNGSQFFITTVPTPWLDGKHTVFGRVTKGMDVVQDIERVKTNPKSAKPIEDVAIMRATVLAE